VLETLKVRGNHRPLLKVKVPAFQINADHVGERVITRVILKPRLNASLATGSIAVTTVEDHPLINHYRLVQTVLADVFNEALEVLSNKEREKVCQGVEWNFATRRTWVAPEAALNITRVLLERLTAFNWMTVMAITVVLKRDLCLQKASYRWVA
jgi:hypothetical protein